MAWAPTVVVAVAPASANPLRGVVPVPPSVDGADAWQAGNAMPRPPLLVALLAVSVAGAQVTAMQSALDTPVRALRVDALQPHRPCDLWRTVEQIARFSGTPIGFEHTPTCAPNGWSRIAYGPAIELDGMTPRQAFDHVVASRPDYAWRVIDGVVVLRPVTAWTDASNVLHRPVAAVTLTQAHPHQGLHAILAAARPSLYLEHEDMTTRWAVVDRLREPTVSIDTPIDMRFEGGTLLDALNALARPSGANWELGYWGKPHVTIYAPDFDGGATGLSMRVSRPRP